MVFRRLVRPLRRLAAEFFYNFGLHCAQNQIRVILISDLVITSLFYPALAIYFSAQPLSHYSTRLHASLFAFNDRSDVYRTDLREIWEVLDDVRIREDSAAQARCGAERTIRVESLFLSSAKPDDVSGALNKDTLVTTWNLQQQIDTALTSTPIDLLAYLKDPAAESPRPLTFGPLMQWYDDGESLSRDRSVVYTMNTAQSISKAGIPLDKDFFLAGRGAANEQGIVQDAEFLVLTYFFIETDCHANAKHLAWLRMLQNVTSTIGEVYPSTAQPTLVALQYDTAQPSDPSSLLSMMLYVCYIVIFVHFSGAMRRIDTVHSRFGLAFTGMVEIIASTITSVSVCALWGFRITMVPWAILPVMIVFIGAEDMFILVQSVVSTPVTLPVRERIAHGLSRAGTSNTFKVVAYNAIFGSMAYFATGAIKQFCIFTVVVLVAHWFLIHTFFVAVLAIDIQRLELADLLHQGPRVQSTVPSPAKDKVIEEVTAMESKGRWRFFRRERAAKNGSLFVILSITAVLYYTSLPKSPTSSAAVHFRSNTRPSQPALSQSLTPAQATASPPIDGFNGHDIDSYADHVLPRSPSSEFWHVFNPDNDALLHLRIESPTLITPRPSTQDPTDSPRAVQKRRPFLRTLRRLTWIFRIGVVPMSATAFALYCLLLYLLKDAELLEAQRDRAEGSSTGVPEDELQQQKSTGTPLDGLVSFTPLSRTFMAEVGLIATSRDGHVLVAVSSEDEIALRKLEGDGTVKELERKVINLSAALASLPDPTDANGQLTAVALNYDGSRCAVGMSNGVLLLWDLADGLRSTIHARCERNPITTLSFIPRPGLSMSASASTIKASTTPQSVPKPPILVGCMNGEVYSWAGMDGTVPIPIPASGSLLGVPSDISVGADGSAVVVFAIEGGSFEVVAAQPGSPDGELEWVSKTIVRTQGEGTISCLKWATFFSASRCMELVVVATTSGRISVYDCADSQVICDLHSNFENVSRLRLSPVPSKRCKHCSEVEPDSFLLAFAIGSVVQIHRGLAMDVPGRCTCGVKHIHRTHGSKNGLRDKYVAQRSRHGSFSASSSPVAHRGSLPGATPRPANLADYPLPSHGYHSRRTSEKEVKGRHSTDTTSDGTDWEVDSLANDSFGSLTVPIPDDAPSRLQLFIPEQNIKLLKIGEVPCERGTWDVTGAMLVGVRRRPRGLFPKTADSKSVAGPSQSPSKELSFARWEAWAFDVVAGDFRSSPFPDLQQPNQPVSPPNGHSRLLGPENGLVRRSSALRRLIELSGPTPVLTPTPRSKPTTTMSQRPSLPFTRVSASCLSNDRLSVGLGNTPCVFDLAGLTGLSDQADHLPKPNSFQSTLSMFMFNDKKHV